VIEVATRGAVAVVTMCHGKANAMDLELCEGIARDFAKLAASPARAIVLTGHGTMFSAGVDLIRALSSGAQYFEQFLPRLRRMFEAVFFCPKPVVAAINGHAIAGGCVLACAADRRLMARAGGRIGITELLVGVPFPVVALEIMRLAAASHWFEELVFGGATYPPEAALALGLVHDVVDQAALLHEAMLAAERLGALGADAFALTKRQTRQIVADRLATDGPRHDSEVDRIWSTPAAFARIRDYVERTLKKS
jgi:enoyl-CoA hydratase